MKTVHNPSNSVPLNMPEQLHKHDASGTDPNRYATPANKENDADAYNKQPDNHTAAHERMLNPDRGDVNNA